MFKLFYVIFRFGHPDFIPCPVQGANNHSYGNAVYDAKLGGHCFRFTQEQWEGTPEKPGAYKGMLKRSNRQSSVWYVRAEVEFDPESAAGQMAQELDAAKAESESLRLQLDAVAADYLTLQQHLEIQAVQQRMDSEEPKPAPTMTLLPPSIEEPGAPEITPELPTVEQTAEQSRPGGDSENTYGETELGSEKEVIKDAEPVDHSARLAIMRFDGPGSLFEEIAEQNKLGANLDPLALNTKVKRREALLVWYASKP